MNHSQYIKPITFNIAVGNYVTQLTLSPQDFFIDYGKSQQMEYTVFPLDADNTDVVWSVVPANGAYITQTGQVTARAGYKTTIYLESADVFSKTSSSFYVGN